MKNYMLPKEQAEQLYTLFDDLTATELTVDTKTTVEQLKNHSKKCALIAVRMIKNANPHSNPINTYPRSTFEYWDYVEKEINKL